MADEVLTLRTIRDLLGCGHSFLCDHVNSGRLVATMRPGPSRLGQYEVTRADLADWLRRCGWPDGEIRRVFSDLDGVVVVVGDHPGFDREEKVPTLFDLGTTIATRPVWAAVLDLATIGHPNATEVLAGFSKRGDRPFLVALFDPAGERPWPSPADVFDLVFPRTTPPDRVRAALDRKRRAKPSGRE